MDEPAHVGCLLQVRLIGVFELVQDENGKQTPDPRLLAVPIQSLDYAGIRTVSDLSADLTKQIAEYLELYNKNSSTDDKVTNAASPQRAVDLIKEASRRWHESQS